eukprot:CAMPEP_0206392526 /NCGR_PEP_ID=MMETSP0294-20121207/20032_1 /ASSEMBLY_ACC=CAM_ASM_000327 /TAXON_ID=39354 /ORGANISM="Heterosigma akashiwo, Strain CCMP2393" /LENGTH=131 /DNA_ID=CAMNT_0053845663 /DNA_START=152 /DNA_END=545 /DNA_ORIENTATION=-
MSFLKDLDLAGGQQRVHEPALLQHAGCGHPQLPAERGQLAQRLGRELLRPVAQLAVGHAAAAAALVGRVVRGQLEPAAGHVQLRASQPRKAARRLVLQADLAGPVPLLNEVICSDHNFLQLVQHFGAGRGG